MNNQLNNIALTPEVLTLFGFEQIDCNYYCLCPGNIDNVFYCMAQEGRYLVALGVEPFTELKYLHQLKEVYHKKTGEEMSIMNMQFRNKPIVINAFQVKKNNIKALEAFVSSFGDSYKNNFQFIDQGADGALLKVKGSFGCTLYNVQPNDWVLRDVKGEYYSCKPDLFERIYEPVNPIKDI